jgi:membrane fusion protein, copper/silver efflux system
VNNESSLAVGHGGAHTSIALLTIAVILIAGCAKEPPAAPATAASGESAAEHALKHTDPLYRCPMHPDVVRNEPGECPICGMALVKVESEPAAAGDAGPSGAQGEPSYYRHPHDPQRTSPTPRKDEMGMDYVPVYADATGLGSAHLAGRDQQSRRPQRSWRLSLRCRAARKPSDSSASTTAACGRCGRAPTAGSRASRSAPWARSSTPGSCCSPSTRRCSRAHNRSIWMQSGSATTISLRPRATGCGPLGLDSGTVLRLASSGRASGRVPFHAPVAGVVTELAIREGAMITPDMIAMTITELGSLWVIAEVPESQAGWVAPGTVAELRFPSLPGKTLEGHVQHVYPELNMETRTVRARIVLEEPDSQGSAPTCSPTSRCSARRAPMR